MFLLWWAYFCMCFYSFLTSVTGDCMYMPCFEEGIQGYYTCWSYTVICIPHGKWDFLRQYLKFSRGCYHTKLDHYRSPFILVSARYSFFAVADPGFPVGGGVHPLAGGVDLQHRRFSVKMYAKMKELGPIGEVMHPARPPP